MVHLVWVCGGLLGEVLLERGLREVMSGGGGGGLCVCVCLLRLRLRLCLCRCCCGVVVVGRWLRAVSGGRLRRNHAESGSRLSE
jgi:hypothetical protein